jgi:hypothetical protein
MRIELWNYDGVGFILLGKSGVIYSTQAAGLGCEHPEEEGWFFPVGDYLGGTKATEKLAVQFRGSPAPILPEEADFLDDFFRARYGKIKVDRSRLEHSREAWVYVVARAGAKEPIFEYVEGWKGRHAIFIWPNSD